MMIASKTTTTLLLALLVVLVSPSTSQAELNFREWLRKQPPSAGCAKKDAALSSAEASTVTNEIDPSTELNPEDGSYKTISESIANIPDGSTKRYILILKAGTVFRDSSIGASRSSPSSPTPATPL